ncbi:hypothetical protein ACFL4N_04045 [Thermodesulfobacteriota bacterium]
MREKKAPVQLTLFPVGRIQEWYVRFGTGAETAGLSCQRKGSALHVWDPKSIAPCADNITYTEGWVLGRTWLGPQKSGLTINPHRLYFEGKSGIASQKQERELFEGKPPGRSPVSDRIKGCLDLALALREYVEGFEGIPIEIKKIKKSLNENTSFVLGSGAVSHTGNKLSKLLRNNEFLKVPAGFGVVIGTENVKHPSVQRYKKRLETAFQEFGTYINVSAVTLEQLLGRLDELEKGDKRKKSKKCLLLGVPGRLGQPLPDHIDRLLVRMDQKRIFYRLFSLENKELEWSARDQAGSLIQAADGVPYALKLPWPEGIEPPLCLGIDLGHPNSSRRSWLAMSLLDGRGVHLESWRCLQRRDETALPETLQRGLRWVRDVSARKGYRNAGVLVLRDGRLHKGERVETYAEALEGKLTFVEVSKGRNPVMFTPGDFPKPVGPGTACLPKDGVTPFVVTTKPTVKGHIPRTLKINVKEEWDGLELGMDKVIGLLAGLAFSPSLGIRPHALPGPIYWANGIASIGPTNKKFAGQRYTEEILGQ